MTEAALDGDNVLVEREEHAGVAVTEVVQGRLRRRKLGGFDCTVERGACDFAFEAGLVSGREDEGVRVEAGAALGDECEQSAR